MKLRQALARARGALVAAGIEDAPLEAELLLRHVLGASRVQLYLDLDSPLGCEQEAELFRLVERRQKGEPSAYITGRREFYGLDFYVCPDVLIPRPESELLVEKAINLAQNGKITSVADIGTGCGAIAVSLAMNLPGAIIYAVDISAPALEVARANCRRHGVSDRVRLLAGDLLSPLPGPVDLIVANLPYVRQSELPPAGFEPLLALDGGPDGLAAIFRLCHQAAAGLSPGGDLLLEVGQGQAGTVAACLGSLFPQAQISVATDLGGIERVVCLSLTPVGLDAKLSWALP
ncbi:MAG: peptide chain release factor N(5)-glutamine methyltransferase [Chloroflexota bacterium]